MEPDEPVRSTHNSSNKPRRRRESRATLNSFEELVRLQSSVEREVQKANEADTEEENKEPKFKSLFNFFYQVVKPDVVLNHLDLKSLQIVFRSWLMMWALTLLCICGGTAEFMGPSSFLANFTAGIEISGNLSVSSAFVFCMTDIVTVMFACCVSVVTMGINWQIRGCPTEHEVVQDLLAQGYCSGLANPGFDNCIEPVMQHGHFLNIKTTVVTIFGMLTSFTVNGYIQSTFKYGKLAWLLNSLYTIIVFPFNNMMPLWKPWHFARNCVVPMGMAFAARFAVSLLVLPFSSNHQVVNSLATACSKLDQICQRMSKLSREITPSTPKFSDKFNFVSTDTQSVFTKFIVNEVDMEMVNKVEVWFSHFEKPDLSSLSSQIRMIMSALSSFRFFYDAMADQNNYLRSSTHQYAVANNNYEKGPNGLKGPQHTADPPELGKSLWRQRLRPRFINQMLQDSWKATGRYELKRRELYRKELLRANARLQNNTGAAGNEDDSCSSGSNSKKEDEKPDPQHRPFPGANLAPFATPSNPEELDAEYRRLIESYEPLISSTCELLRAISQWLMVTAQIFPWVFGFGREKRRRKLQACFEQIREALAHQSGEFAEANRRLQTSDKQVALYSFTCYHFARRVKHLGKWCISMQDERPTPRLVWPFKTRVQGTATNIEQADDLEYDGYENNIGNTLDKTYTSFQPLSQVQERNPDASPPRSSRHIIGLFILKTKKMFYDPTLLFCVKRAVLITATETLYFCRPTCQLAYRHWFLWVAVLTAYTVARQAVDGIYGLVAKFVFNFFGCLVGMVGWYISAGSGSGNPYGYAAVTAFVWLYICFLRQFNNHFVPATSIVFSCTVTLVLGNSWSAGHMFLPGVELGRGFSVAWIRFVTVTIGITISFLGTIFPYSYTAKKTVRVIIGACLEHIGDLHSSISNFGIQRFHRPSTHVIANADVVTRAARALITNLNSAEALRKRLVYEPPLAGNYPTHRYRLLINYVYEITLLYSLTYSFFDEVSSDKLPHALKVLGWTDPQLSTGIFSVLYMTCRALTDGKALPSVTCGNLLEQYVIGTLDRNGMKPNGEPKDSVVAVDDDDDDDDDDDVDAEGGDDASENNRTNKRGAVSIPETDATTMTAVALGSQIYERLDGVIVLVKELVGEVYDLDTGIFDLDLEDQSPLLAPRI